MPTSDDLTPPERMDDESGRFPPEIGAGGPRRKARVRSLHDAAGRVPPQAFDIEKSVLGAMLIDAEAIPRAIEVLAPDAFYVSKHEKIFHAMLALFERGDPVDLITLKEELKRRGDLETAGGAYYLTELTSSVGSAANVEHHARIIVEKSLLRSLISTMTRRIGQAYDAGADAFELLDQAEGDIFSISKTLLRRSTRSMKIVLKETIANLESTQSLAQGITGVPSGFSGLDELTGGWQNSDLIIIAARPSMGKCLAHDATIVQADGSVRTIEDICKWGRADLLTLGEDGRFHAARPAAFLCDGLKPVFRVTTRLGRRVDTTLTHPFLTRRGWEPLSALRPGEDVAVPRKLDVFGRLQMPERRLERLAFAIAEDPLPEGGAVPVRTRTLEAIPSYVFRLKKPLLAHFLQRLFASEANRIVVRTWRLAHQAQHLLLRFGILSQVAPSRPRGWGVEAQSLAGLTSGEDQLGPELYFDKIVSLDALGIKPVYDLSIPDTHNFVANDVCVHNTALALACGRNAALHPKNPTSVAIFSLEMSAQQLAQRLLTSEARVDAQAARTGRLDQEDWRRLSKAAGTLFSAPIFLDDTPGIGILELRAKCRRLKTEHDIGLVLVDYLQLMHGPMTNNRNSNREQEIAHISRSLKSLAKELNVPVIALSQLNRQVEARGGDKRPQLSDLRESGSIEQDADVVAFIYRAERYGIPVDENGNTTEGIGEIIVGKQRNGPTGNVRLAFVKRFARFENLATFYARPDAAAKTPDADDEDDAAPF